MHFIDLVLQDGNIITMDKADSRKEAVAVKHGRIVKVGSTTEIRKLIGDGTRVIELDGRTVLPGFIDTHNHMMLHGLSVAEVDCKTPPLKSISEVVARIRDRAKTVSKGSWLKGFGYTQFGVTEGRHPTRWDLDEATVDHPIILHHYTYHVCVINTRALGLSGIVADTPDPPGGRILKDKSGEPSGVLFETAQRLVERVIPPPSPDEIRDAIRRASKDFVKVGITTVHDAGPVYHASHRSLEYLNAYKEAERTGDLLVRVHVMISGEELDNYLQREEAMSYEDDMVRVGPVKIFVDGAINIRTAAMSVPYADSKEEKGLTNEEGVVSRVVKASRHGLQVAIHAIGDRGIDVALDAFEATQRELSSREHRCRLVHGITLRPDQIERIKNLGVVVDGQPIFIPFLGEQFIKALGPERSKMAMPFKTLLDKGVNVAGGSDAPCTLSYSPLDGMYCLIRRITASGRMHEPGERLPMNDAMRMYTTLSAYNSFEEKTKGSIEEGKLADLVVLSKNPFDLEAEAIANVAVEMTIVGGKVVYSRGSGS